MKPGDAIDETGLLLREDGAFWLQRDAGGRYLLDLRRTPIDEVEKRVRVVGTLAGSATVEVEGVALI